MPHSAKDIVLKPIEARRAREVVQDLHYSGKVDPRSQLHVGIFLKGVLEGAMQFGPPVNKHASIGLVEGTKWHHMIELNRMALSDRLPRNCESRALAIALRMLKKHAPQLKWVVTYADAAQCGDGTIYRAGGWLLTDIKKNDSMWRMPDGEVLCSIVFNPGFNPNAKGQSVKAKYGKRGSEAATAFLHRIGAEKVPGYQLRYIKFLDPSWRDRLLPDVLPYSTIDELGAGMYRGEKITYEERNDKAHEAS